MRNWIIAAALAFAAPAWAQSMQMPAPAPDGAIAVAADQSGQTIEATVGAAVAVQLQSTPSAGTSWVVAAKPDFLDTPEQLSGSTVQSARPVLGAPRWQVFVFPVTAAGSGELSLEKRARDGSTIETFSITVNAAAAQ